ncbi:MAG: metal ABC transporter ATP-binding protein [Acidimicrobiales bacterium]
MSVLTMTNGAAVLGGRRIWSDATFTLEPGTITAVLGPNGAGKSTLLNIILGLVPLAEGTMHVLGEVPHRGNLHVGYMAQTRQADAVSTMTGRDFVGLGFDGPRFGWGRDRTKKEVVRQALALTGTTSFADQSLHSLSGGQRQRIALAHSTVFSPELLLLDEPLAALDLAAQVEIVDLIKRLRDSTGAAVVVVAHDLNPLSGIVDQVLWIARHQVRCGTVEEVVNEEVLSDLYGQPIEIIVTPRGRRVIVGLEEELAHPHPHGHDHSHDGEHAHDLDGEHEHEHEHAQAHHAAMHEEVSE